MVFSDIGPWYRFSELKPSETIRLRSRSISEILAVAFAKETATPASMASFAAQMLPSKSLRQSVGLLRIQLANYHL